MKSSLRIIFTVIFSIVFANFNAFSANLKGKIKDAKTGEPLVGATVILKNTKMGSAAGLDGSFEIKNIGVGSYEVAIQYIGYESVTRKIEVKNEKETISLVLDLNDESKILMEAVVKGKYDKESVFLIIVWA